MSQVLIVVEPRQKGVADLLTADPMASALKQAIATSAGTPISVQVIAADTLQHYFGIDLELTSTWVQDAAAKDFLICPLTLNLPPNLTFSAEAVYKACRDVPNLRQRVAQQLGSEIGDGYFWLPVVLTAKGPLYGEVIGLAEEASEEKWQQHLPLSSSSYYQPFHLSDAKRQQVYQMGYCLLQLLSAPPATYLVQFGFQGAKICFDRLWPFPAAPAIASLGIQEPNLFACHWYCLASLPIFDLTITSPVATELPDHLKQLIQEL